MDKTSIAKWCKPGVPIWYEKRSPDKSEIDEFLSGYVKSIGDPKKIQILLSKTNLTKEVSFNLIHQRTLDHKKVKDLAEIPILNDAEIMAHIEILYLQDEINVYCGPSLVVTNPYKKVENNISSKTLSLISTCYEKGKLDLAIPHVWTISAQALENLEETKRNQAICINGESGAGKTVSTKMCLEFLTQLQKQQQTEKNSNDLCSMILACNPVLEAFGNAKTNRNDNSSRFGKYVKLFYDLNNRNKILGATTENYLLEKIRVIHPSPGERSFHIFYAICQFMPEQLKKKYFLYNRGETTDMKMFSYLRKSGKYKTDKINDREFYDDVVNAFKKLRFSEGQIDAIFRILAAILYVGNLKVDDKNYEDGKTPARLIENDDFNKIVKLLECDRQLLQESLTLKVRKVQSQVLKTPYRPEHIHDYIGSFAKEIYNKMFNWLVLKMNLSLHGELDPSLIEIDAELPDNIRTIGILDIFGFEIFDNNYLEQLFINYANERLQGLYIDHIFKNECTFFVSQGLKQYVHLIEYDDNIDLIKILDYNKNPIGVFPLTNQMSQLNKNDDELIDLMKKNYKLNNLHIQFNRLQKQLFSVRHTAKDVEYNILGFIDKNKDEVSQGIKNLIDSCHIEIVKIYHQFYSDEEEFELKEDTNQKSSKQKFLAFNFTKDMNNLIYQLNHSDTHFIRCVKPNELKKPNHFVFKMVLKQITYMGLLNSLKIRKRNYVFRFLFKDFYLRYQDLDMNKEGSMSRKTLEGMNPNWRKLALQLLDCLEIKYQEKDLLMGTTKILINDHYMDVLNELLKIKQRKKREAFKIITILYQQEKKRKKIVEYFKRFGRCIRIAKMTLTGIKAKVEYSNFRKRLKMIRKFQYNFRITQQYRQRHLQYFKMNSIKNYLKLHKITQTVKKVGNLVRQFLFCKIRLRFLVYKTRKKYCQRIVYKIFNKAFNQIKQRSIDQAAAQVQCQFRSYLKRKKYQKALTKLENNLKVYQVTKAAILIQSYIRRFLVQQRFNRLQRATSTIQRYFRTQWLRNYFLKLIKAVRIIQRFVRNYQNKHRLLKLKFQEIVLNTSKNLQMVQISEYQNLFQQMSYYGQEHINLKYHEYLKNKDFQNYHCQQMVPDKPVVQLKNKANIFSLIVDFTTQIDTQDIYDKSWSKNYLQLLDRLHQKEERLLHIKVGDTFTFIISDLLKVYSFGNNSYQQLGVETTQTFNVPPIEVKNLSRNKANVFECGKDSAYMICQNKVLMTWGSNQSGQLGTKDTKNRRQLIVKNDIESCCDLQVDQKKTYVLQENGQIISFPNFQEGLTNNMMNLGSIRYKVEQIACGSNFLFLLTKNGYLYSKGENKYGQLGLGDIKNRKNLSLVQYLRRNEEKIVEITCGFKHVLAKTSRKRFYAWGNNLYNQLCLSSKQQPNYLTLPKLYGSQSSKNEVISIAAGMQSSYFLKKSGQLFMCGKTGIGVLSQPQRIPYEEKYFETKMNNHFKAIKVNSSWSNTISLVYLTFIDFRECKLSNRQLRDKISQILLRNWKKNELLPMFDKQLQNYINRKYFKQYENQGLIDTTLNNTNRVSQKSINQNQTQDQDLLEVKQDYNKQYDASRNFVINRIHVKNNKVKKNTGKNKISKNILRQLNKQSKSKQQKLMSFLDQDSVKPQKTKYTYNNKQLKYSSDSECSQVHEHDQMLDSFKQSSPNLFKSKHSKKLNSRLNYLQKQNQKESIRKLNQNRISYKNKNSTKKSNKSNNQMTEKKLKQQVKRILQIEEYRRTTLQKQILRHWMNRNIDN